MEEDESAWWMEQVEATAKNILLANQGGDGSQLAWKNPGRLWAQSQQVIEEGRREERERK